MDTLILSLIFFIIFFVHNKIFFYIVEKIIPIKQTKTITYILSFTNTSLYLYFIIILHDNIILMYVIVTLIYYSEIIIYFDGYLLSKMTAGLTLPLHLMSLTIIVGALMAKSTGRSIAQLMSTEETIFLINIIVSFTSTIMDIILLKIISPKYFKLINNKTNRLKIFLIAEISAVICLIVNSLIFKLDIIDLNLIFQQVTIGFTWIIVFYTCVFMLIGFDMLEEHKQQLQAKLIIDNLYKDILIGTSEITLEINCNTGNILNYVFKGTINPIWIGQPYEKFLKNILADKVHPEDKYKFNYMGQINYMTNTLKEGITKYNFEYRMLEDEEKFYRFNAYINLKDKNSNGIITIITINNIQLEKDLLFRAERDGLSGLYNKVTTEKLISAHLDKYKSGVLFLIDIDNFKAINDNLGHNFGDEVIRDVSKKISTIFGNEGIVGRMGGDEFCVFMGINKNINIEFIADNLCKTIANTYSSEAISVSISASIGIVQVENYLDTFKNLYIIADAALYKSKNKGKNVYTITHKKMK